ncbi:MAG: glycosyltransferase family 2 protein [Candidatus Niyogibacteria bacterium]|nr:MAG: glycosyltransferase family 2 protein [Candidatus Niyogibacteria bacterium]
MLKITDKSISVFIPVYNERDSIGRIVSEIDEYLKSRFTDYEILLITSEASTDGTNEAARGLESRISALRTVSRGSDFSYGGALRTGFKNSVKELIFFTDGDRQFDISEMDKFLPLIHRHDIVTGYKIKRNDPLMRVWMSWIYNITMRLLFGLKLKDVNCAFKLYKREVIEKVDFLPDLTQGVVNAEIYLSAIKNGYSIGEVGVNHFHRMTGFADSEIGRRGKIIAFVRPRVISGFLKDTYKLFKKTYFHGWQK